MTEKTFLQRMYEFLETHFPELKGTYFSKSENQFGPHPQWLFDSPHGYWGENPDDPLSDTHSKRLTDLVTDMIRNAESEVDITNLRLPSGAFKEALITGIKENTASKPLKIRILCGKGGMTQLDTKAFLRDIQTGINNKRVEVYAGIHTVNRGIPPIGWNHAKYIAVDGKTILFGGHNYIDKTYLGKNPIFDISVKMVGPLVAKAHFFSNELWKYVNQFMNTPFTYSDALIDNKIDKIAAPPFNDKPKELVPAGKVPVVHVTQPGHGLIDNHKNPYANPSLSSIYFAMANARKDIYISQQDIGGAGYRHHNSLEEGKWDITTGHVPFVCIRDPAEQVHADMRYFDVNLLHSLTNNLSKNDQLTVQMVLSNRQSTSEEGGEHASYSNDVSPGCVFRALGWYMVKRLGIAIEKATEIIKKQVFIRTIGFAKEKQWRAFDKRIIGNHAKFWAVDDEVCSIGSNNFYPSTIEHNGFRTGHHQEWAVVIGNNNENVVKNIREDYFNNVYNYSVDAPFRESYLWAMRDPQGFPKP